MNTGNDCLIYLIGNQKDNEDAREVNFEKATVYSRENGFKLNEETSAKTGENVEDVFVKSASMLYSKFKNDLGELVSKRRD